MTNYVRFVELSAVYANAARQAIAGDPHEGVRAAVSLCEAAPDDDHLVVIAVNVLDALLDIHWDEIGNEFEAAMRTSRQLRRAYSCTMIDIPRAAIERLNALVAPDEDLGHERP